MGRTAGCLISGLYGVSLGLLMCPLAVRAEFSQVLNIPPGPDLPDSYTIHSGIQVNLGEGGAIGNYFAAGSWFGTSTNVSVVMTGGTIGNSLRANPGSTIEISGGRIGYDFEALRQSSVILRGGEIGQEFSVLSGSTFEMSGGSVGDKFLAKSGSQITISGGTIGRDAQIWPGTSGTITGGVFADGLRTLSEQLVLVGSGFRINGEPVVGLDADGSQVIVRGDASSLLSGVLRDGTAFLIDSHDSSYSYDWIFHLRTEAPDQAPPLLVVPGEDAPRGVRSGQLLAVNEGGRIGDNFNVDYGGSVRVAGGTIGDNFEAIGAEIELARGEIGREMDVYTGTRLTINGGRIGDYMEAFGGSVVEVDGGTIGNNFTADVGSEVHLVSGIIEDNLVVQPNATVIISGGSFGRRIIAYHASKVVIRGGDFRIAGEPLEALDEVGSSVQLSVGLFRDAGITGILEDGTPFSMTDYENHSGVVTFERVELPEPTFTELTVTDAYPRFGIRRGQSIVAAAGGSLANYFNAEEDSVVEVRGGAVGRKLEAVGAQVRMASGSIGADAAFHAGAELIVDGGDVGTNTRLFDSRATISAGLIEDIVLTRSVASQAAGVINSIYVGEQSAFQMSGGFADRVLVREGGEMMLTGGYVGQELHVWINSHLRIRGGDFRFNGTQITPGDSGEVSFDGSLDGLLTGVLSDGNPFAIFPAFNEDTMVGKVTLEFDTVPVAGPKDTVLSGGTSLTGLRSGQTITVLAGGRLNDHFTATEASQVRLVGGEIGSNFEAAGAQVVIVDGTVGDDVGAMYGSYFQISGGSIGDDFHVYGGAEVDVSGGDVGDRFVAQTGSKINITGGDIGEEFTAWSGASITISGGRLGKNVGLYGSDVSLFGSQFFLDGVDLNPTLHPGVPLLIAERDVALSGVFADGTPFKFDLNSVTRKGDFVHPATHLTITLVVPEPNTDYVVAGAILALSLFSRRRFVPV